ncbi:hypothetical protein BDV27DRAFT_95225 [Aspergillus caelatus]|uniref:Uncharacterized protein n=2 Tax=Aspergillus subgen. Circumdati TaxID=2720871 RepID=A0A5N6ZHN4_9EURO|nr:uncharacterized protein BDV27DRAFT_95225 [Aspergillus caelatus]KAE8357151.1 hypothetical protein BDV27DRAFT_95225 [Aspergillus caelatus]KAE8414528.1 hypothetical protein BDV36DRAFT_241055 [Aspergillus pseudocaelatus]
MIFRLRWIPSARHVSTGLFILLFPSYRGINICITGSGTTQCAFYQKYRNTTRDGWSGVMPYIEGDYSQHMSYFLGAGDMGDLTRVKEK